VNKIESLIPYCIVILLLLVGCKSIRLNFTKEMQYEHNNAIVKTIDEQLLLNIVRSKYHDNPYFLEVNSILENRKFSICISSDGSKNGFAGKHELGIVAYIDIF
jgi:hypothetical protein